MKKEQSLKVIPLTRCSTIDQLSNAVKQKEIFIEITDELKEEFLSKIKTAFKDKDSTEKLVFGITVPETFVIGAFMGASIQISILAALCRVTFMGKISNSDYDKYEFSMFEENEDYRFLLIRKKPMKGNDRIVCKELDLYRFVPSDQAECPKCGKKIKDFKEVRRKGFNPYLCAECGQRIIWSVNMQDFASSEIKTEKDRQRMLKKYGIHEERYLELEADTLSLLEAVRRRYIASEKTEELCKKFRIDLKTNKFIPEPAIDAQDGTLYEIVKTFYSAPFGTAECELPIMDTARFINIRSRQIRGVPFRAEMRDAKYVAQSYALGLPVKINGKYENALKEAAWFAVISYLCDIFLPSETICKIIPTDKALYPKWNSYIESMSVVPQEIKELFILNGDGDCGFIHEIEIKSELPQES